MESQLHDDQANNEPVHDETAPQTGSPVGNGSGDGSVPMVPPHFKGRELWRSLEQLSGTDDFKAFAEREFQEGASRLDDDDRRQFLKIMGASVALAGLGSAACRRLPETKIAPYAQRPEDRMPGVPVDYASNFEMGGVGTGVLVRSFDGRPIFVGGNQRHPGNERAAGSMAQGTVVSL